MGTLYIAEFADVRSLPGGAGQIAYQPPLAEQTVAIGGASAQSNAFNAGTRFIRVHTDAICSILIGANPTATAAKVATMMGSWSGSESSESRPSSGLMGTGS